MRLDEENRWEVADSPGVGKMTISSKSWGFLEVLRVDDFFIRGNVTTRDQDDPVATGRSGASGS